MAKELPITEFDMITLNQTTQMFKAMLPFLDYSMQRSLSLFIRMNEFQQTMQFYSHPENINQFATCSNGPRQQIHSINDILGNEEILGVILKYCPEQIANMINTFRQFSKMSDLMNMMNTASGGDFSSMFNNFNPDMMNMLNPDMMNMINPEMINMLLGGSNPFAANSGSPGPDEAKNSSGEPVSEDAKNQKNAGPKSSQPDNGFKNMVNNFMNPQQQQMYDEYITQLDHIDFEKNQ